MLSRRRNVPCGWSVQLHTNCKNAKEEKTNIQAEIPSDRLWCPAPAGLLDWLSLPRSPWISGLDMNIVLGSTRMRGPDKTISFQIGLGKRLPGTKTAAHHQVPPRLLPYNNAESLELLHGEHAPTSESGLCTPISSNNSGHCPSLCCTVFCFHRSVRCWIRQH